MKQRLILAAPVLLLLPLACGGPGSTAGANNIDLSRPALEDVTYGRLTDIYAYERIDVTRGDRRDQLNRRRVLVQTDVVVRSNIESQSLYDAAGNEVDSANYEFLPFDISTGHDELLILWDDRGDEADRFQAALSAAQIGLSVLPPSFRGQNTSQQPIPVLPRDSSFVLRFSGPLGIDDQFFAVNPSAVQVLEFNGDPNVVSPADAFRSVPFRVVARGNTIIIDPTILGGEARGGFLSSGLPPSLDSTTANIRLAIPSRGSVSSAFFVRQDPIPQQNGVDSFGRNSVIRDFRSGNANDGAAGVLRDLEPPVLIGNVSMGITDIDASGIITLNKRLNAVPVRGRFPFVAGAVDPATGYVLGPATIPTSRPLRSGDFLLQTVAVQMPDGSVEPVRIRAEILQNLNVGTVVGDPNFAGLGLTADGTQGQDLTVPANRTARVRVGAIRGTDSLGRPVAFVADPLPEGADCELRRVFYQHVRFQAGSEVVSDGDVAGRFKFLKVDPQPPKTVGGVPVPPGERVLPSAAFAVEFSEPMDFDRIDPTRNLVMTDATMPGATFATLVQNAKILSAAVVPVRWSDQSGDGTVLQLQPPMGLFHRQNTTPEQYWFHVLLGSEGITDLAGNPVELFNDDPATPVNNWSVGLTVDPAATDNRVGWHCYPFESADEDGTAFGSIDIFGQYRLIDGRLLAAETVRFNRTADDRNLAAISRTNRGECPAGLPANQYNPQSGGVLYWTPRMIDSVAPPNVPSVYPDFNIVSQPVGHVIEPHQPRGSRMMMRYLEDDFGLSNRQASDMVLDVEQLYWSPFADFDVAFDVFDRYTMALAHSDKRPDEHWSFDDTVPVCQLDCPSAISSLSTNFSDNLLRGSQATTVFEDKVYKMDPNDSFRSPQNVKYIRYPRFDRTYTWRDYRLVTVTSAGTVIGLGGARNPQPPQPPNADWTTDVDSPWVPSVFPDPNTPPVSGIYVQDEGDFRGDRQRDHDPIALPLLVDFKMFPDGPANSLARGVNGFQVAMLGPPSNFLLGNPGGYYNLTGSGCAGVGWADPWPFLRVHTTGGLDPTNGNEILVDPANTTSATGGWIKDAGALVMVPPLQGNGPQAIIRAPAGDGMLHWASADFVRRVSTATFGFMDTMKPNQRVGALVPNGFPDFTVNDTNLLGDLRILDFAPLLDPPLSQQPAGTSLVLEIRGANTFDNADLYNPIVDDTVEDRGNLLNPNYACEAYRYSKANSSPAFDTPRIVAQGLTAYVTPDRLSTIRNELTGLLPRYINFRLVMTNNIDVTPAISPSLRSLSVVYSMRRAD